MYRRLPDYMLLSLVLLLLLVLVGCGQTEKDRLTLITHAPTQTKPHKDCDEPICNTLLKNITNAEQSIDFAVYGLRGQPQILKALEDAKKRGVEIRGVVDKDVNNESYYGDTDELISALGTIRTDYESDLRAAAESSTSTGSRDCERPDGRLGPLSCFEATSTNKIIVMSQAADNPIPFRGDIMHNKFFVFDEQIVWTGSANLSDTGIGGYNANTTILIDDKEVARWYQTEFEKMYVEGRYHNEKDEDSNNYEKEFIDGTRLAAYFSPGSNVLENTVLKLIKNAEDQINVSIFFLTHKDISRELIHAKDRGVRIRVLMDASGASNAYSKHEVLRAVGIQVKIENWGGKMHAKAASADGINMVIGSTNWTAAGQDKNDENLLLIENSPRIVAEYDEWFKALWDRVPTAYLKKRPLTESLLSSNSCSDGIDNDFDRKIDDQDEDCSTTSLGFVYDPAPAIIETVKPISKDNCPSDAPIKGNISSRGNIYHVPSGDYYLVTDPETCFYSEEDAQVAGFRASRE